VQDALDRALATIAGNARRYYAATGAEPPAPRKGLVLTFDDLRQAALAGGDAGTADRYAALMQSLEGEENPLLATRTLVAHLVAESKLQGPVVIVGLGSLYYPHTHLDPARAADRRLKDILETSAARIAARHGTSIRMRGFFSGICDMSFFGHRPDEAGAAFIHANTPSAAHVDHAPDDALSFPSVNIGPWGREYHQKLERVHGPYAFEVLPDLLHDASCAILGHQD
jgi:arginine utilization protein RocB